MMNGTPAGKQNFEEHMHQRVLPLVQITRAIFDAEHSMPENVRRTDTELLKYIIDKADVMLGVYNDPASKYGLNWYVIKGTYMLSVIKEGTESEGLKLAAVPCKDKLEAIAMNKVFGDKVNTGKM